LILILISIISIVSWSGVLITARWKLRAERRSVTQWMALAIVLIQSGVVLSTTASQRHWTLHHVALGAIAFVLPVAGLACLAMAAVSWRRRPGRRSA
jgi:hypothetical protein